MSVEEEPAASDAGLKLEETPPGSPLAARPTDPAKPPVPVTPTVKVVPPPAATLWLAGETPRAKSDCTEDWTTSVAAVVCWREPLVPLIVNE